MKSVNRPASGSQQKVLVALGSGPSSLAVAWLLKKQGKSLRGVYFDFLQDAERNEWIRAQEKKLGFPIQIVDVRAEFDKKIQPIFKQAKLSGERVSIRGLFQREVLFPKLFEFKDQYYFDQVATGHSVQLQYDHVEKVARVYQPTGAIQDETRLLFGVKQEWLQYMELPLGSIPDAMIKRISDELDVSHLKPLRSHSIWKNTEEEYLKELSADITQTYEVYSSRGERMGSLVHALTHQPGDHYVTPTEDESAQAAQDLVYIWKIIPSERRVIADMLARRTLEWIKLKEATWFSFSSLGMKGLEATMTWWNCKTPVPVKVIEYEGKRLKVILNSKLSAESAALFPGNTVLFLQGNEILGGAEVLSCE